MKRNSMFFKFFTVLLCAAFSACLIPQYSDAIEIRTDETDGSCIADMQISNTTSLILEEGVYRISSENAQLTVPGFEIADGSPVKCVYNPA